MSLTIIFAGTPEFAAHHLQALIDSDHKVVAVYTQPDRPAGRGKKLTSSAVKKLAQAHRLPIEQPISLKDTQAQNILVGYQAEVMVVVAYGLLLPTIVLKAPRYGCLNVHGSILPRWRGAAPIQRAIEAGDKETGITIMQMDKGLDTGDMLLKKKCSIENNDSAQTLHDKLMKLGASALLKTLDLLENNQLNPKQQDDTLACYAEKINKQEAKINWQDSAKNIARRIRAFNPVPVAYSFLNGDRIKILKTNIIDVTTKKPAGEIISMDKNGLVVSCGEQALCIKTLQVPGKKAVSDKELLHGYSDRFVVGHCFSD
ncbi:methionyl-tRNA formyltransferase [Candidatus Endobugula sertula]|uniref:Methionyl-tRNA formyltransferase n=1 Tax=Candidatus Endobugula sertula TaxID=62101 RepID=A0A1D2QNK6_9GAMM|nr:methionyl-tRNA formyltransferase [Candidatus Endobugula sertula]